ncbi:MAG: PPOX class F420-dependent oxidoreductase [Chloroflexota bacterium]
MPEQTTTDSRAAILRAQYVALTTYRLDGRAVTTPVWAADQDGRLLIFSNPVAGKMKRLQNSSRATVAPCTWNGTLTGTQMSATARILAPDELNGMWSALVKKYRLPAVLFRLYDRVRGLLRMQVSAGIEVSLTP